ncbi:hypothetical protein BGW38_001099 [Lunasporangiospora selenospora]|uniref:Dymeclin n=1 Tax=Lunasporangiospora selenospora TaxID=979761 RepID=A0A9P6KEC9_9FUNG|nr:hypothetical protein BGW38_001099 [Lunasporangiospora selenospora]
MSTKPDPARATSPSPAAQASESLAPIAPAHQRFSPEVAAPFDQLEISSTHRKTGASGAFGGPLAPVQPSHPTGPANTRTSFSLGEHSDHTNAFTPGSYIQGTDRPLASGLPLPESSYSSPRSLDGQGTDSVLESFARRESLSLNQGGASRGRRRSLFLYQQTTRSSIDTGSAINTPESDRGHSSGYYTFAPDHSGIPPDVPSPGPHSPAFSISTFSGIIPASTSISSIIGSTQSKPPTLEFRHPITIKELETISILGPSQILAAKTLCSSRVLSRIDTIGWYSILGAQKFPAITSSQDAYDIEMATTCMSIEFGANNVQTQNFNTLILQLLSQIKLIKDQDYKGDIPSHAYNALFLTRIFLNHFITHLGPGSELSAEAQQEALGVVSFKGCKLGVDQSIVSDTRSYAEQLIQGPSLPDTVTRSSPSAYEFYEETLNLVTVMASTQIQLSTSALSENNYFLNMILQRFGPVANRLILRLLWNFTDQRPSPPHTGSLVYNAYNYLFSKTGSSPSSEPHPIADRSLLLLLLFHVQAKGDSGWDGFRKAIRSIRDERGELGFV